MIDSLFQDIETQSDLIKSQSGKIDFQTEEIGLINQEMKSMNQEMEYLVAENNEIRDAILQMNGTLSMILDYCKFKTSVLFTEISNNNNRSLKEIWLFSN